MKGPKGKYAWTTTVGEKGQIAILAVLGCGRKYFNRKTAFARYLAKASLGIYVLYYPILVATCYIL